ncbi:Alpha/Beta hydrolase protein [Chaetomium fimeti]|uniref:Alpha/Beta hydrolase protein n=1 Tax=Chaetomium fimeti TaxID=1854472 RepID=A0AAE0LTJ2_9PEZI|nr:Alpha/Beta hydrolase protein [Chaetomium fimeti]
MATTIPKPLSTCCLQASLWEGTPTGTETTLDGVPNPTYVAYPPNTNTTNTTTTTTDTPTAILYIHDLLGWDVIDFDAALAGRYDEIDIPGIMARQARAVREPEVLAYARALRGRYERVGAVGYCYGGWAALRLAAGEFKGEFGGRGLVDCVSVGHPSLVVEGDFEGVRVPVQLLAPEVDEMFTPELKLFAFLTLQKRGVPFDYQHFPGVEHWCLVRGNANVEGERAAMTRGHEALVAWFKQWLQE